MKIIDEVSARIDPTEVKGMTIVTPDGRRVAYICAVGNLLRVSTRGWSDCTIKIQKTKTETVES